MGTGGAVSVPFFSISQDWMTERKTVQMKKLWCAFRRRDAVGAKICGALAETEGRVRLCPYATEPEAVEKCQDYAFNTRTEGEDEGIE